jgi:hypothetical protein
MKHIFFFLSFLLASAIGITTAHAQCTPGPQTQAGFYPTTNEGIHPAAVTDPYSLNVTIVVPKDTAIAPFPSLNIDSATINQFFGFPAGFQYSRNTPSGWIKGGEKGCILITGTPNPADEGIHSISFVFTALIMGFVYTDTIEDFWTLEIKDDGHVSISENGRNHAGHPVLFPNPAVDYVQFVTSETGNTSVTLFEPSGRSILTAGTHQEAGSNFLLPLRGVAPGIYLVRITHPSGITTTGKVSVAGTR